MKINPHSLLFFMGAILLLVGFLVGEETIDIHVHDTYYIIWWSEYYIVLSFLLILVGLLYWVFRRYFHNRFLTWLHVIMYLVSIIALAIFPFYTGFMDLSDSPASISGISWVIPVFGLLALSNILFLFNIITGWFREKQMKRADH